TAVSEPFAGFQQMHEYRLRYEEDEPGTPLSRIAPRALIVPPGIPEFLTRARFVPAGPCRLEGRAWSGLGEVTSVEVSDDGGVTWASALLDEPLGPYAWRGWSYLWEPPGEGEFVLACRATDSAGNTQPLEPAWNLGGYVNNAV